MRADITSTDDGEKITIRMHLRLDGWGNLAGTTSSPFLSFDFPFMHPPSLDKFISGRDCEEQDDNGFYISSKNNEFTIRMCRDDESAGEIVLHLSQSEILDALMAIRPIYAKIVERIGYDVTLGGLEDEAAEAPEVIAEEPVVSPIQEPLQKQVTVKVGDYTYTWKDGKVDFTSTSEVYHWKDGEVTFHPQ